METKDAPIYKKFTVVTKAELSKYNEGFESFFNTFNETFKKDRLQVQWEEEGHTLRFSGQNKTKLSGAMGDFGFGGHVGGIELVIVGTPVGTITPTCSWELN